jgi:hypothetical protein
MSMRFAFLLAIAAVSSSAFAQTWKVFSPPSGGFSVEMPAEWKTETEKMTVQGVAVELITAEASLGDIDFTVGRGLYPAGTSINLDGARDGTVQGSGGKLRSAQKITIGKTPGYEMIIDLEGRIMVERLFIVGNVSGAVVASGADGIQTDPNVRRFLDSLKVQ